MPITGSDPAFMQSLSGVLRAGAGRSGYLSSTTARLTINGVAWDTATLRGLELQQSLNQNATEFGFTTKGQVSGAYPSRGKELILGLGSINNRLFGGYVLKSRVQKFRQRQTKLRYSLTCVDYSHALDRTMATQKRWDNRSPITILADLLYLVPANRRITPNMLSAFSNLDTFETEYSETVRSAVERLARRCAASWYVDAHRYLHFFSANPGGGLIPTALTDSATHAWNVAWDADLTQVRTRVIALGGATELTADVTPASTSVAVKDVSVFSSSGGTALVGNSLIAYTGKSTTVGAGSLTGVTGIAYPEVSGAPVRVIAIRNDSGAQTTNAARYGGSDDGVTEHTIDNSDWSDADAIAAADAELALGTPEAETLTYTTRDKGAVAGAYQSVNLTDLGVNSTFLIHTVRITEFGLSRKAPKREVQAAKQAVVDIVGVLQGLTGSTT